MQKKLLVLFALVCIVSFSEVQKVQAQITPQCPVPPPPGAESCQTTCVYCDFNGYMGTNSGTPSGGNQVCGQISLHNDQWFGFVAGSECITINIATSNCEDGNGLQAAFFSACNQDAIVCNPGQGGGEGQPLLLSHCGFEPGNTYYLMVDGWVGDVCDYTIEVLDGSITPPPAGQPQPIQGPTQVCPGATVVYTIPDVDNASFYKWTAPAGAKINGLSNTLTIPAPQGAQVTITFGVGTGQVCVSAANACSPENKICLPVENKPIPPTIRPKEEICFENRPFIWDETPNTILTAPGTYNLTSAPYASFLGCDSIVKQTIVIKPQIRNPIGPQYICEGDCFVYNNVKYCKTGGPYQDKFISWQGCDSLVEFSVIMIPANATIATPGKIDCASPTLVLDGTGSTATNNTSYNWTNASWSSIGTNITQSVNLGGTYHLIVTHAQGIKTCRDTATVTINQNTTPPGVNISGGILNCVITSTELNAVSPTSNVNYSWQGPGINFSNQNQQNPVVSQAGTYTVTAKDPVNSCTSTASFSVKQDTVTPALSVMAQTLNCINAQVTLDAGTNTNLPWFEWTGPGINAANKNIEDPIVALPGLYNVTLTDNNNGCTHTKELLVNQDIAVPEISAGPDRTITCRFPNITLQGSVHTGTSPSTIIWTGNGIGPGQQGLLNPQVNVPDTYVLKVTNNINGCVKSDTVLIDKNVKEPIADAGPDTIITCKNPIVSVGVSGTNQGSHIVAEWTGSGVSASNKNLFVFNVTQPDLYELLVTDTINGCVAADFMQVSINKTLPEANAGKDAVLTCNLTNGVILDGSGNPSNIQYHWSGPGIGSNNEFEQKPTITQPGDYSLTVTNPINGCTAQDLVTILKDNNVPLADAGDDLTLNCSIKQVDLDGSKSTQGANISFKWQGPGIQGADSVAISPKNITLAGSYTLTVLNTANGCKNTDVLIVLLDTLLPSAVAVPVLTLNCYNKGKDTLDASLSSAGALFAYDWAGPGIGVANKNLQNPIVDKGGAYSLTVTNTQNTCFATTQVQVNEDLTNPLADAGPDPTIDCVTTTTILGGNSSSGLQIQYDWFGPGIDTLNQHHAKPNVTKPGEYHLTVKNNVNGCHSTDTVIVLTTAKYPIANAGPDDRLSCTQKSVLLDASASTSGASISYLWSGPGITLATQAIQSPVVDIKGIYILSVKDASNQCVSQDTVQVDENIIQPIADAPADLVLNCKDKTVVLDAEKSSTGPLFTYEWTGAGINPSNQNQQKPVVSQAGLYELKVSNTDNGCTATVQCNVSIDTIAPSTLAGPDALLTCTTQTVTLDGSASSSGTNFDLVWQGPGIVTSNYNLPQPSVSDSGTYVLTILNKANFCSTTDKVLVLQNTEKPKADAGAQRTINCALTNVQLDGTKSGNGNGISYEWSGPGLLAGQNTLISPVVDQAGIYLITVTDAANGCTASDAVEVLLDVTPPQANAGPDRTITCNNNTSGVALDGSGSDKGANYDLVWSGPGITPANATQVNPTVLLTGDYIISIRNKTNGCVETDTVQVVKDQNIPIASAGLDQTLNCKVKEVILDGSGSSDLGGGIVYQWGGPDINPDNIEKEAPSVTKSGTYTITVIDNLTGCKSTDEVVVLLDLAKPSATIQSDVITCLEPKGDLNVSANPQGCTYEWAGPDINSGNINAAAFKVSEGGLYTVTITAPNGCTNTATATMAVDADFPDGNAEGATLNCTNNGTAIISGLVKTAGATFEWKGPNNFSSKDKSVTVTAPGQYIFLITAQNGCQRPIEIEVKTDYQAPTISLSVPQKLTCSVTSLIINAFGTSIGPNFVYEWRSSDGNIVSGEKSLTPRVNKAGTYTVVVTNLKNGCTAERDIKVENDPDVPVAFELNVNDARCFQENNGAIQVLKVKGGVPPFVYSLNGGVGTQNNQFAKLIKGEYLLSLEDANGCVLDTLVKVDAPDPLLLDLGPDQRVQLGDSVTITSTISHTTPLATTTWNYAPNCKPVNGLCTAFTYLPLSSYRHKLTLRDSNGCEVSDVVLIEVIKDRLIFVPNIFRPESNDPDNFRLMVYGGKGVKKIRQWLIHDRWGSAVFEARDFLPNDTDNTWNGKIKGEKANPGVYAWYLEAEFEDGVVEIFKGDVTLIR